jgi:hypothetical protein
MIRTLMLICLPALAPAQDDEAARVVLTRVEEALARAKTITLRSRGEAQSLGESVGFAATVLLKGARASITSTQKVRSAEQSFVCIIQDGRLQVHFDGIKDASVELPEAYPAELRTMIARCGIFPLFALTHPSLMGDQVRSPGKIVQISNLKLGEEARSLTYTLTLHGMPALDAFGGAFSCTLRLDPASGKMLGRTLTASTADGRKATISETYEVTLDADLPDALLRMPERKSARQGGYRPTECLSTQCPVELADAQVGRWMTYLTKTSLAETRYSLRVVGKIDTDWLIESWFETDTMKYAWLYQVGPDRRIRKAWTVAEGDPEWTPVPVKETPKLASPDTARVDSRESEEKKQVAGGIFDCTRIDATLKLSGASYKSSAWYSKDAWRFVSGKDQPGGLVAMESGDARTTLEARGEDARPTVPLPKEGAR